MGWRDITSSRAGYQVHTVKMKSNWSIPNEQVFEKQNGSYIAFLQKDESPFVFDVITKQVDREMRKLTGEEFVKRYFDKVDKNC